MRALRCGMASLMLTVTIGTAGAGDDPVEDPATLTAEEFATIAEGHTLFFNQGTQFFGAEQYFGGQRSVWKPANGDCDYGTWWQDGPAICFSYEEGGGPSCWFVSRRDDDLYVRNVDDPTGLLELRMVRRTREPLDCPGPATGV